MKTAPDPVQRDVESRHAEALAALGASGAGAVPPLAMPSHSGLDGRVSLAVIDGAEVVVKTFHRDALPPGGFAAAAEAHALASAAGHGPRLVVAEADTATLVTGRLGDGWRQGMVPDFVTGGRLAGLLSALKDWHGAGTVAALYDPQAAFARAAEAAAAPGMLALPATAGLGLAQIGDWVARIAGALDATPVPPVLLHGEMMLSNVMLHADGALALLDFDRAAMGDPLVDIAQLSLELCVDDTDRAALLRAWTGREANPAEMARLKLLALVEDARWALWALAGEASEDRKGPELYKYACNRLVRFRLHLSQFDMAALLKEVQGS